MRNVFSRSVAMVLGSMSAIALAQSDADPLDTIPVPEQEEAEAVEPAAPARGRSRLVEEIVVTAQKREEDIQDVPISISAFTGESLDAKGITDPKTLAQSIPGVTYGETVNFSIIYVRGVGTDACRTRISASRCTWTGSTFRSPMACPRPSVRSNGWRS
jgi:outer membrane receptor protein involved in Fe transport